MQHKHGGDIYSYQNVKDFSANINFRGMPLSVQEAARAAVLQSVHYPDPEYRALRESLAQRECALTDDVRPEQIICGNGAAELMFAYAAAVRPKRALLAVPSFFEYEQSLGAFGCALRRFRLRGEQDFLLTEAFFEALDAQGDLVVLGNPNNPTGRLLEGAFLERLLKVCGEREIRVVLDESFFDFLSEADRQRTFSGVQQLHGKAKLFVLRSFTKMYGMPGLRFGYGVCAEEALLARMREKLQPWNVSLPAEAAARAAASEQKFAQDTARQVAENRAYLAAQLREAGYTVFPSEANFLLLKGREDLQRACLAHGFLIRDCGNFPGLENGFFRICVRSRGENEELLNILRRER